MIEMKYIGAEKRREEKRNEKGKMYSESV